MYFLFKLTGKNDVKDARVPLSADLIGRRTHQGAVILIVKRRVRQLAPEKFSLLIYSSTLFSTKRCASIHYTYSRRGTGETS